MGTPEFAYDEETDFCYRPNTHALLIENRAAATNGTSQRRLYGVGVKG